MTTKRYWLEVPKDRYGNDRAGYIDVTDVPIVPNPADPSDPSDPSNPNNPNNPIDPSDPADPIDPSDPQNPNAPSEPVPTPIDPPSPIPHADGRPRVFVSPGDDLWESGVIYDLQGRDCTGYELTLKGSSVEIHNGSGLGKYFLGSRDGGPIQNDVGMFNCDFGSARARQPKGRKLIRPWISKCRDVNPQPHTGEGDVVQFLAYEADIISPMMYLTEVFGMIRPANSAAHNDGVQFEGLGAGKVVDPWIVACLVEGAANVAVLMQNWEGVARVIKNTMSERWGGYHAMTVYSGGQLLLDQNKFLDGASVNIGKGATLHPDSDPLP